MTPAEKAVWIAVYSAMYAHSRWQPISASECAQVATFAVRDLDELAHRISAVDDGSGEARDILSVEEST